MKGIRAAVLGISAFYHVAAAFVVDGKTIAAVQEKRFTRRKHGASGAPVAIDGVRDAASS